MLEQLREGSFRCYSVGQTGLCCSRQEPNSEGEDTWLARNFREGRGYSRWRRVYKVSEVSKTVHTGVPSECRKEPERSLRRKMKPSGLFGMAVCIKNK